MTTSIDLTFAHNLGVEFAQHLNKSPIAAQGWSALDPTDDLPEFDYSALRDQYGLDDLEPREARRIVAAYRDGFNDTFRG